MTNHTILNRKTMLEILRQGPQAHSLTHHSPASARITSKDNNMNHLKSFLFSGILCILSFLAMASPSFAADKQYYQKTLVKYRIPDVVLLDHDGKEVRIKEFFDTDQVIIVDFIYGTCTTICPVLSVGFSYFQKKTLKMGEKVRLVSFSIDPDNDTPEIMREYLERYDGQTGWTIFTGKRDDITAVLRSFDAYVSNKMDHYPLTIMRGPEDNQWVRLHGMLSASDLMKEYMQLKKE